MIASSKKISQKIRKQIIKMRQQRLSPERRVRRSKYAFQAVIDEVRINVKFPCRIAVGWNYGDGEVRTPSSKPLTGCIAKFDDRLAFETVLGFDEEAHKFQELKSTVEISIITDNGTSLAGFVPVDLGNLVNRKQRKEMFEIQRCPDKSACIRMRISYRYISQKPKNQVRLPGPSQDFQFQQRTITPKSQYLPKTEYLPTRPAKEQPLVGFSKNRELIQKELLILKGRVNEYETKFKNERAEKEKLAELLKGKEEVFFTMKTEIKRKEIETEDLYRALEEFRAEYQRLKTADEGYKREAEKTIKTLEVSDRAMHDKIVKLELDLSTAERKSEKTLLQSQRLKKEKQNLFLLHKQKLQQFQKDRQGLNDTVRAMKKQRQETLKLFRTDKDSFQRTIRQLSKSLKDSQQQLDSTRSTLQSTQKRLSKFQQCRLQQFQKLSTRLIQLQKSKQSLYLEHQSLKISLAKKQTLLAQTSKSYESRFTEEKTTAVTVKAQLGEVMAERAGLQKELLAVREALRASEEEGKRLDRDASVLKGQVTALTEQLQARNLEVKALASKQKDLQEEIVRQQALLQESHEEAVNDLNNRIKEIKRAEEVKNTNNLKLIAKKQKQFEELSARQVKLNQVVEQLKQQLRKNQQLYKDKLQSLRKSQTSLKQELQQQIKRSQRSTQQHSVKLQQLTRQCLSLQQSLSDTKDLLARSTQRESQLRSDLQSLSHSLMQAEEYKQLALQYEGQLREADRRIGEMMEEAQVREVREMALVRQLAELKERGIEVEADRNKREAMLRDKDKQLANIAKQMAQDAEDRKKEFSRREVEVKALQDQMRDTIRKQRAKYDQLSLQHQRTNNELSSAINHIQQLTKANQQLASQLRLSRQTQRSLLQDKQQLLRFQSDAQRCHHQLQQLRSTAQQSISLRDKQIRSLRQQLSDSQRSYSQLSKLYSRNNLLVEELVDMAGKLTGMTGKEAMSKSGVMHSSIVLNRSASTLGGDYDRLLELRKMLAAAEGRWRREFEAYNDREGAFGRDIQAKSEELDKLQAELQRYKIDLQKVRKENEELLYSQDFLKIQNQQLRYQLQGLQSDISSLRSTNLALQARSKELGSQAERGEKQSQQLQARYDKLLEQARATHSQKTEKLKKQFAAATKKLETKVEELEEKNFQLELEAQKVGELARREEEFKKAVARVFELERQNQLLHQNLSQKAEKAERELQKVLWEKKSLEDSLATSTTKLERTSSQIQQDFERTATRCKQLTQQLRDKQLALVKAEELVQRLQFELNTAKSNAQQDRDKWIASQNRLKTQITKLKTDLQQLKKSNQQQRQQLLLLQSLRQSKLLLQSQVSTLQQSLSSFSLKDQKQCQQIFTLSQQLQQSRWQLEQRLQAKESEIISMQEHLYAMNSKENVRLLRESEVQDRVRQLEVEKRGLARELHETRVRVQELEDRNRVLVAEKREIDQLARNPYREDNYQELLKGFEREIKTLKQENQGLKVMKNTATF